MRNTPSESRALVHTLTAWALCAAAALGAGCGEPLATGQQGHELEAAAVVVGAVPLELSTQVEIEVFDLNGTSIAKRTQNLDAGGSFSMSFTLLAGATYSFEGRLTPAGASSPTHAARADNVTIAADGSTVVDLVLRPVEIGATVRVSVTNVGGALPTAIHSVRVFPSDRLYGGESAWIVVETTTGQHPYTFGWSADDPIDLDAIGGDTTAFVAPTKVGTHSVRLHVFDGSKPGEPTTLTIPVEVVPGGLVGPAALLSDPTTAARCSQAQITVNKGGLGLAWKQQDSNQRSDVYSRLVQLDLTSSEAPFQEGPIGVSGLDLFSLAGAPWLTLSFESEDVWTWLMDRHTSGSTVGSGLAGTGELSAGALPGQVVVAFEGRASQGGKSNIYVSINPLNSSGRSISSSGTLTKLTKAGSAISGHVLPAMATMGKAGVAVTWQRKNADGTIDRLLARVAADGTRIGSNVVLGAVHTSESRAAISWSGGELALAWLDERGSKRRVFFARFDANLTPLKQANGKTANAVSHLPARAVGGLLWGGMGYGLLWADDDGMFFSRVLPAGSARHVRVSSDPLAEGELARGKHGFYLVKTERDAATASQQVFVARVDDPAP